METSGADRGAGLLRRCNPKPAINAVSQDQRNASPPAGTPGSSKNEATAPIAATGWLSNASRYNNDSLSFDSEAGTNERASGTMTSTPSNRIRCIKSVSGESPIRVRRSRDQTRPPQIALRRPQLGLSRRRSAMCLPSSLHCANWPTILKALSILSTKNAESVW
jgi:hypothetical protein